MIEINNLTKRYNSLTALNNVTLSIPRGEVLGLLGPNGAGKTTLLKLIAGLIYPNAGQITQRSGEWPKIGLKPERLLFPNHLRIQQYLALVAGISDVPAEKTRQVVAESLAQVGLTDAANKSIANCSKGMRQRLGLAQVLVGNPALILLDEPSNGLDPEGQQDIHHIVQGLQAAGKTIVMSSHQLQEVTDVCTQIVILHQGKIHYENSMSQALAVRAYSTIVVDKILEPVREQLLQLHPDIHINGTKLVLENEALRLRRHIMTLLLRADYDILEIHQARATLAEIYAKAVN